MTGLRFATLLVTALGLALAGAHALELVPRMAYDGVLYAKVTSTLYRFFAPAGAICQVGGLLLAGSLAYQERGRPGGRATLGGALALLLSLGLWAAFVAPVNAAWGEVMKTAPAAVPEAYLRLRPRWEYGHLAAFGAWLLGYGLLVAGALRGAAAGR